MHRPPGILRLRFEAHYELRPPPGRIQYLSPDYFAAVFRGRPFRSNFHLEVLSSAADNNRHNLRFIVDFRRHIRQANTKSRGIDHNTLKKSLSIRNINRKMADAHPEMIPSLHKAPLFSDQWSILSLLYCVRRLLPFSCLTVSCRILLVGRFWFSFSFRFSGFQLTLLYQQALCQKP